MACPPLLGTLSNKLSFLWQSLPDILVLSYPRFSINILYFKALVKFESKFGCQSRNSFQERGSPAQSSPGSALRRMSTCRTSIWLIRPPAAMLLPHSLHHIQTSALESAVTCVPVRAMAYSCSKRHFIPFRV